MISRARSVQMLSSAVDPLVRNYDVFMFDLDGVLYRGAESVPHAAEAVQQVRDRGAAVAYVTNNASRTPEQVAARLRDVGIPADGSDVVTSAQAAARLVAERVPPDSAVLVVGGDGVEAAVAERGLRPVRALSDDPAAVLQGYGPDVAWTDLAEATYAVAAGLPWFATNTDLTIPTARGIAPGNGTLVAAVAAASGEKPLVAGKPQVPLFDETVRRVGGQRPLVVGDRLDTDVEGANAVGSDSLLVLTGVTDTVTLCNAAPVRRPTFVAPDLRGLDLAQPPVESGPSQDGSARRWLCGDWRATVSSTGVLEIAAASASGRMSRQHSNDDTVALLRAGVAAAWAWRDSSTQRAAPPDVDATALAAALGDLQVGADDR